MTPPPLLLTLGSSLQVSEQETALKMFLSKMVTKDPNTATSSNIAHLIVFVDFFVHLLRQIALN